MKLIMANDVPDTNVGDKLKPLNKWTLEEVADYCHGRPCEECMFRKELRDDSVCGFKQYNPAWWRQLWTLRFTPEEVADAKALARLLPLQVDGVKRDDEGDVIVTYNGRWAGRLTRDAFPSIKPGQSVKLSEIIGEPEV